jgi:antitoxin component YwqK of YwqJK toxin-antitoxin module
MPLLGLLLIACDRRETVETYADGQRKLVREYSWPGAGDSLRLRRETAYYSNGKVESETPFRHGVVSGEFKAYWPSGALKARGAYVDGRPEGGWEYYYNAYTYAARGAFRGGRKEGPWTEYWENGELRRRGDYRGGKEVGEWVGWNSAGAEVLRTSCFESNAAGRYRSFHDDDSLWEDYACRGGLRVGPYLENDPDGKPRARGFYDSSGAKDSLWTWFHADGRPSGRQRFRHGLWADSVLGWDSLGRVTERGFFRLGTGTRERFGGSGRLVEAKSFRDGKPLALKRWHPNGRLSAEGGFADGKKAGVWRMWDSLGRLRESAEYLNGELHGERLFFDSAGALTRRQEYFHGLPSRGSFPGRGNGSRPAPAETGSGGPAGLPLSPSSARP